MTEEEKTELPKDREAARLLGASSYFDGRPCPKGHLAPRNTRRGYCSECAAARCAKWYAENKTREDFRPGRREYARAWGRNNKDKVQQQNKLQREKNKDKRKKYCADNREKIREAAKKYHAKNRERINARGRESRVKDKSKMREYNRTNHIKIQFGLSRADYDAMLRAQNGVCKICGKPETTARSGNVVHLSVDHCHKTGAIRGLLCNNCNAMLSRAKDDPAILAAAIEYLKLHSHSLK